MKKRETAILQTDVFLHEQIADAWTHERMDAATPDAALGAMPRAGRGLFFDTAPGHRCFLLHKHVVARTAGRVILTSALAASST